MTRLLAVALLMGSVPAAQAVELICANRAVYVTLSKERVKDLEALFAPISSLPFQVVEVSTGKKSAIVAVTYRRLTPGDDYAEPTALELSARVYKILEPSLGKLGIKRISAAYDPASKC